MPTKCLFKTIADAVAYAKHHGGWIARCGGGVVAWYDAAEWTLTPILMDTNQYGDEATIGVWPLFDPDHESHQFLTGKLQTVLVLA